MNKRNIITIDGLQAAILDYIGVLPVHKKQQFKKQFADEHGIDVWNGGLKLGGVGCIFATPEEGLPLWKPK